MPSRIPGPEVDATLDVIGDWVRAGDRIKAGYRFGDFQTAFDFMTEVAAEAERLNHHPEWSNVYTRASIRLTTHDADGLTDLDFRLAAYMETVWSELTANAG